MSPHEIGARAAAARIAARELTSEELVRSCLERIEAREGTVRAFAHLDPERALDAAREVDAAGAPPPLHGVPIGVKDIIDTASLPTEYGSPIYRGHRPARDAACVRAIRAGGGVVLGKTVTTEFAFRHPFGRTTNPHDPAHTPGGSSSGSAAGVADRMMPLALGTQTGGSVIRPAAFCGVFGYKASFGLLPFAGVKQLAQGLDTLGVLARDVPDLAFLAAALVGTLPAEPTPLARAPRLRIVRAPDWSEADASTLEGLEAATARLRADGAVVEEAGPQPDVDALSAVHATIMDYEAYRALETERTRHAHLLSDELREILDRASAVSAADYAAARTAAAAARPRLEHLLAGADALLTASAPGEAPAGLAYTGSHVFNRVWTLLGAPCVSVPGGRGHGGLPIGVQLVGLPGADERLLAVADRVAEAIGAQA